MSIPVDTLVFALLASKPHAEDRAAFLQWERTRLHILRQAVIDGADLDAARKLDRATI